LRSTDGAELQSFFERWLVPAAARLRAREVSFFPNEFEPQVSTWYEGPPDRVPAFMELGNVDDCLLVVADLWARQGRPELVELIEPLRALAKKMGPKVEQPAEVSGSVYVMY
jgi:hypothetical protein